MIAVLKSDAPQKEKSDACRELAMIGTKNAVAPLADLLGDEKLSHMARYGLEPNPDPAVDDALAHCARQAQRPTPRRHDREHRRSSRRQGSRSTLQAIEEHRFDCGRSHARALGLIGTAAAAKALEDNLATTPAANRRAHYEGLFRSAEALTGRGQRGEPIATYQALEIYERLARTDVPQQVRESASRKARVLRQEQGPRL